MDQIKTGNFISAIRKEKGLTQEELGQALGVSQRSVSRWETGRNMPDLAVIPELCELLDISISEFVSGERSDSELSKEDVTKSLKDLFPALGGYLNRKKISGAIITFILMVVLMAGLYNMEFSVKIDTTAGLEAAINEYNFDSDLQSDVLETETLGNRSYVLYKAENHKGCYGVAELEKGLFGRYRILQTGSTNYPLVSVNYVKSGGRHYAELYCINELTDVKTFDVLGYTENADQSPGDPDVVLTAEYTGSPFLIFAEIEKGDELLTFPQGRVYYNEKGNEIDREQLERSFEFDEEFGGSTFTVERGMIYIYEGIIFLLGIIIIRFFMTE